MSYGEKKTTLPSFAEDKNVYLEIQMTQPNTCRNQRWLVMVNRDLTSLLISVWVDPWAEKEHSVDGGVCVHVCGRQKSQTGAQTVMPLHEGTEQVRLSVGAREPVYGTLSISSVSAFVQ